MKRSTKAGIASAVLFASTPCAPYREWRATYQFCLRDSLLHPRAPWLPAAARKWWLVIPASIVAGFVLDLYLVIYAL